MTRFFDQRTGRILTRTVSCSAKNLALNTPAGTVAIEGQFDPLSQRVDVEALARAEPGDYSVPADFVVDHEPELPDDDHEFRATNPDGRDRVSQRWRVVKKPEVRARERKDAIARARLEELDVAMVRPISELIADPTDAKARARIDELKAEAAELRKDVIHTDEESALAERLALD